MAKFVRGDVVKKERGGFGIVRAIFRTREGEQMYAVERDGAFDFVDEPRLARAEKAELAA